MLFWVNIGGYVGASRGSIPKEKSCNENCYETKIVSRFPMLENWENLVVCTCHRIKNESHYNCHYNFRYKNFLRNRAPELGESGDEMVWTACAWNWIGLAIPPGRNFVCVKMQGMQ